MTDPIAHIDGIVHGPTQREGPGVDLTLDRVCRLTRPGRVDFGGGELSDAETEPVPTDRRHPDDEYGWWNLDAGQYLVAHNESLDAPEPLLVQPRDAILARNAFHPTVAVTSLHPLPLAVGHGGIHLKENARLSTVLAI